MPLELGGGRRWLKTLQLAQANTPANEHTHSHTHAHTYMHTHTHLHTNGAAEWQANVALFRSLTFGRRQAAKLRC